MAKVSGYIRQIKVDIGDRVKEGQLLATLEIPEMQDDLTRAAAAIEEANAELATARDELQRAESAHEMAHLSYSRDSGCLQERAGTGSAAGSRRSALARSGGRGAGLRRASRTSRLASSVFASRRPSRRVLKPCFSMRVITAPFAGVVTKRYANTGSLIQAGTASQSQAMPVVRLSENGLLRLALPVPESAVPLVHLGEPVDVRVSALHRTFPGRVARFSDKVDQSTRTMKTEVDVPNPSLVLVPGMYAEVDLVTDQRKNVLVGAGGGRRWLRQTQRASSRCSRRERFRSFRSRLGIETARQIEIRSGDLKEGDDVVVGSRAGLKDGNKVQPKVISLAGDSAPKS